MRLWAADKLKKNETLPSWMATMSCEVVKRECPLHIWEIIAREDDAIQHNISTFRLYQVGDRSVSWQSECTMSVLRLLMS